MPGGHICKVEAKEPQIAQSWPSESQAGRQAPGKTKDKAGARPRILTAKAASHLHRYQPKRMAPMAARRPGKSNDSSRNHRLLQCAACCIVLTCYWRDRPSLDDFLKMFEEEELARGHVCLELSGVGKPLQPSGILRLLLPLPTVPQGLDVQAGRLGGPDGFALLRTASQQRVRAPRF